MHGSFGVNAGLRKFAFGWVLRFTFPFGLGGWRVGIGLGCGLELRLELELDTIGMAGLELDHAILSVAESGAQQEEAYNCDNPQM